jgi:glycerol-3-phosphate acyltransferase PlsY
MAQNGVIGLLLAGSYLLGSLPFGLWVAKRMKGVDIRTVGSGNIGSTNVGRICGPKAGAAVFCLDVLKGLLPPLAAMGLGLDSRWQVAAGLMAIIGHNYSVWLGFKGGKGIATSLGALVGTMFKVVPPLAGLFLVTLLATRWVSLGSILCALALPLCIAWLYPGDNYRLAFGITACVMAVYKHRSNIGRLRAGKESKVHLPWDKPNE